MIKKGRMNIKGQLSIAVLPLVLRISLLKIFKYEALEFRNSKCIIG